MIDRIKRFYERNPLIAYSITLWVVWTCLTKRRAVRQNIMAKTGVDLPVVYSSAKFNNPLNIRYSAANNWQGQTGNVGGFCSFDSFSNGVRASQKLIRNYIAGGVNTVKKIINKYAPDSDGNNGAAYIKIVLDEINKKFIEVGSADRLGQDTVIDNQWVPELVYAMARVEVGSKRRGDRALYYQVHETL